MGPTLLQKSSETVLEPGFSSRMWVLALFLILVALSEAAQPNPRRTGSPFHDPALHQAGMNFLEQGQYDAAVASFCKMLRPPARGELWTLSVVLLCDPSELAEEMATVKHPLPVFVQVRYFEGKRCYRICAGLTTSRSEASRWIALLPENLRGPGPFPVRVVIACESKIPEDTGQSDVSVAVPPSTAAEPPPEETEPAPPPPASNPGTGRGHVAFLGPPAREPLASPPASPGEGESWFQKGLEAYRKGNRLEAYECYNRALEIDPDRPEVLNNLGVLYLEEKQYAKARDLFRRVVEKAPSYSRGHLNLAGALWGLNDRDGATQEARIAVELDQRDVNARLTLASFFLATDRKEEAADQAKRVLLLDPGNAQAEVFLKAATARRPEATQSAP
jgi:tetratricopeptide (TPR) repeat protein